VIDRVRPEHERVAEFLAGLNDLCERTDLMPMTPDAEAKSVFRLVRKTHYDTSQVKLTADAAHYVVGDRVWVSGAEKRAIDDPAWAKRFWGEGRRQDGNEPLPGPGPRADDDDDTLRRKAVRS
jgi:hypothetical protein